MTRKEEIKQAARNYFDEYMDGLKGEVLTVQQTFEDAAKWADKTIIYKACEWLNQELCTEKAEPNRYYDTDVKSLSYDTKEDLLFAFRKAMEE